MSRTHPIFIIPVILYVMAAISEGHAQAIESLHRASLAPGSNQQGRSYSYDPEIDGSGRYVIFTSTADNFAAPGNVAGSYHEHVYLRDTALGTTIQLDVTSDGRTGSPGISFNPNVRTFGSSFDPHISRDGSSVVFLSAASDISPDGQGESFGSWVYLKDLSRGEIRRLPFSTAADPSKSEYPAYLAINGDGTVVVIVSIISDVTDTDCASCVWHLSVYERSSDTTTLLSTGVDGNKFNPGISDDGRYIVFENQVGNFDGPTYSYLYDRTTAQITALNQGREAQSPAISGDGAFIAYADWAASFPRVILRERESGLESVISHGLHGEEPLGMSEFPSLSIDGRYTAFLSSADNLVAGDDNGTDDIFVYDRVTGRTTSVSVQGECKGVASREDFNTGPPSISSDGSIIAFTVLERLQPADVRDERGAIIEVGDSNSFDDVYVTTLNYEAQPSEFRRNLTPTTPLVSVNCSGAVARMQIENVLAPGGALARSSVGSAVKRITQELLIRRIGGGAGRGQVIRRLTAKRNILTTRGLATGSYSVQVRAVAKLQSGRKAVSRVSNGARFVITK